MRLMWKDAGATGLVAAIVAGYVAYLARGGIWFLDSPRWIAAAALIVGLTACGVGGSTLGRGTVLLTIAKVLAGLAGVFGILTIILGSAPLLACLIGVIVLLWLTATVRHAVYGQPAAATPAAPKAEALRQ